LDRGSEEVQPIDAASYSQVMGGVMKRVRIGLSTKERGEVFKTMDEEVNILTRLPVESRFVKDPSDDFNTASTKGSKRY
jgi:hypothetical protein